MKGVTVMDENHSSLTGLNKLTNVLIEASFNFSKIGPSLQVKILKKIFASSGNRTRAARVAGEHSTTEPTMLGYQIVSQH